MQPNAVGRAIADPGNLVLLLIGFITILLMLHGDTIIKIPRYRGVEYMSKESGEQFVFDEGDEFLKLEQVTVFADPTDNPNWQPPCLPNEAPDYEEKMKKLKEDLEVVRVEELVEKIENEFKEVSEEIKQENAEQPSSN